jgi:hypothetical protein
VVEERPTTVAVEKNTEEFFLAQGAPEVSTLDKPAILYFNSIKNTSSAEVNGLLRFYSEVLTSNRKTRSAYTLFDSGASHGFVDEKFAKSLGLVTRSCGTMKVTTANDTTGVIARNQVYLTAKLKGITGNKISVDGWYTIFDLGGNYDLIVGKNWMVKNPHVVDHNKNILHVLRGDWASLDADKSNLALKDRTSVMGLRNHQGRYRETHQYCRSVAIDAGINLISAKEALVNKENMFIVFVRPSNLDTGACISEANATCGGSVNTTVASAISENNEPTTSPAVASFEQWKANIHENYADLFEPPSGVPPATKEDFRIITDPLAKAPYRQPYRQTIAERAEAEKQIRKLLENGWVGESHSRFAAPIIFVKKGDGSLRMCVDYRALNKITAKDRYPLPYIDDLLDRLNGSRLFTKLDLASGYHQLRIHEEDRHKTAFVTPDGFYEWKVIPFGLANAPAAFMRRMNSLLRPHKKYAVVYLDDILIYSATQQEHKQNVEAVLRDIRAAKFKLNGPKCTFATAETTFVGYKVTADGIDTEAKKIEAICSWSTPKSAGQLRSFLGLAGYYRRFVDQFAKRTNLLHDLVNDCVGKHKSTFAWSECHANQFDDIKRALSTAPVLATLAPETDFILRTDASEVAIGAVLSQKQSWKGRTVERPLGFFSRKLHDVESRYPAYDRELLAIHDALKHWECYVHGSQKTTIYTDHSSLQHILSQKKLSSRQWRHLENLQQHDYEIKYFPGAANVVADALSRREHPERPLPIKQIHQISLGETEPRTPAHQLNDIELRIDSAKAWLDEVRDTLKSDHYFSKIVSTLAGLAPHDLKSIPPREAKDWRKAQIRASKFILDDGLLYRKTSAAGRRLCIPGELTNEVLQDAHDAPGGGGHNGVDKTVDTVSSRFYWPKIFETVRAWIRGCATCLRIKPRNQLPAGLLSPLDIPAARGERVNIDFITKLPTTTAGNDTIVTIIDGLTKRVRWFPTTEADLTAERFAELFLQNYVRHRGIPASIVSDRDTRFVSEFWGHLTSLLGTRLRFSTAFHPQTDGLAEKANSTVQTFLRAYAVDNLDEWDQHLPLAEFTYNSAKHKATGSSPFEADIGFIPRIPLDFLANTTSRMHEQQSDATAAATDFARSIGLRLKEIRERLERAQEIMAEEANRTRRPHNFKTGDRVFLDTKNLPIGYANVSSASRKLQHRFTGPFRLGKQHGQNAFQLDDLPSHWRLHDVFNVDRLRPDTSDTSRTQQPPPPLRSTAKLGAEWEIESIRGHHGSTMKDLQYEVKWAGYDKTTWEPILCLKGTANEFLRAYHEKEKLRVYNWMREESQSAE